MATAKKPARKRSSPKSKRPVRMGSDAHRSEKVQNSISTFLISKKFIAILSVVAVFILLASGIYLWFNKIYSDPEHVFWSMMDKNLATASITKETGQNSSSVDTTDINQLLWNTEPMMHSIKDLSYKTTKPPTELKLEVISTPKDDYQRYYFISRPVAGAKSANYSKVYDLWLKNGGSSSSGQSSTYSQQVFGAVFFGNFLREQRLPIINKLKEAYQIDYNTVNKTSSNGRRVYVYHATIKLAKYADAAHDYATLLNLPGANNIKASSFKASDTLQANIKVDVLSGQIKSIQYINNNVNEKYSDIGVATTLKIPSQTVDRNTFQKAIQAAGK